MMKGAERRSIRFHRLLDELGVDTPAGVYNLLGHLDVFNEVWFLDPQLDNGLLWDVTPAQLGRWAEWPRSAVRFGRALIKAGYVKPVEKLYPPELLKDEEGRVRTGYVVMSYDDRPMLEVSWNGWHLRRGTRFENVLYLTDPDRRWRQIAALRLELGPLVIAGRVPEMWLEEYAAFMPARGRRSSEDEADEEFSRSRPGLDRPIQDVNVSLERESLSPRSPRDPCTISFPVLDVLDAQAHAPAARTEPCSPPHVGNEREKKEREGNGRDAGLRSGRAKSDQLRREIIALKETDLLASLLALDETDTPAVVWLHCVEHHPAFVRAVINSLLTRWTRVNHPPAWVYTRLRRQYDKDRQTGTKERGGGEQGSVRAAGA